MKPQSEGEAELWEALDVDDSDLSSFICPYKSKVPPYLPPCPQNPKRLCNRTSPNSNLLVLQSCSPPSSQTLTLLSDLPQFPLPPETSSPILVPGPAGVVQSAMLRKRGNDKSLFGVERVSFPTQEYIRRAVEEPSGDDEDFSQNPWLSAVEFICSEGLVGDDGVAIGTPVSLIKKGFITGGKVDQVVGILKSCTPNGLGDLMVTLKDPTGTIDGNVHHKILAESEFAKDIHVGAVLILRKVAVFAPSRSSRCINVTLNNLFKVITNDNVEKRPTISKIKTTGDMTKVLADNAAPAITLRDVNAAISAITNNKLESTSEQLVGSIQQPNAAKSLAREPNTENVNNIGRCNKHPENVKSNLSDKPLISGGTLLQWTDEQLDELFAFD